MPGIVGLATSQTNEPIGNFLSKAVDACSYREKYQIENFVDQNHGFAFSRLHLGIFNHGSQPVYSQDKQLLILFDGELYNNSSGKSDPEFVLERYQKLQDNCAREIDGIYTFVIFDLKPKLLKIFNDSFGFRPIYYYAASSFFAFASEIKAILPFLEESKKRDNKTVADFFVFGFPLGDETLFSDIRLLPAASCLTFDLNSKKYSIKKYWRLTELFTSRTARKPEVDYSDGVDAFIKAVDKRCSSPERLGLSLSGGLDCRSILAALSERAKDLRTYTVGLKNCRDESLSQRMSKIIGSTHEFVEVNLDYLNRYEQVAEEFIYLTDGLFHPREGTEIVSLNYFRQTPFKISLRGHGGEIAKAALAYPVMVDSKLLSLQKKEDIVRWILEHGNYVTSNLDTFELFNESFREETKNHTYDYLQELLGEALELLEPGDVALYFYIDQLTRRLSVPSFDIFRSEIEIRIPYFDLEFLKILLKLPIAARYRGELQRKIVSRCKPELMKVPDSNTGSPLDAKPWEAYFLDKVNSLFKKLSLPGYRHYTEYPKWQRKYFRDKMKQILFSEKARQRNIYQMNKLEEIFQNHMEGKRDAGAFLSTAVGVELWHRRFLDSKC